MAAAAAAAGLGLGGKPVLNRAQRHRAQQIYDFCQLEGGKFWDYRWAGASPWQLRAV